MRKIFYLLPGLLLLVGCESFNSAQTNREQSARARESARIYEQQVSRLNVKVNSLQDNNAKLVARINDLQRRLSAINQRNQRLEKSVVALKQELARERQIREQALREVVDLVAKETASAINKVNRTKRTNSGSLPIGSGDFFEYTVQPGATLSAIAKAYKVKVSDIRKANGLKSDLIRVGQKLYIPKK